MRQQPGWSDWRTAQFRRTDHPGASACWLSRHPSSARRGMLLLPHPFGSLIQDRAGSFLRDEFLGASQDGVTSFQEALNLIRCEVFSEMLLQHRLI